jgi:UDP-glucose 4-epimerase
MTKILVTGSAGLIGRRLVHRLHSDGYEVVGLDLCSRLSAERGDVRDPPRIARALVGCQGVIHLAAVARVLEAAADPERCRSTNITGTRVVVQEAIRASACRWALFASSREVYGQPAQLPVTESAPTHPLNLYGRSKLVGERIVRRAERDGLAAGIVRLTNTYGSTNDHPDRVVPAFVRAAVSGAPIRVEGTGNRLDLLHVDDVVAGLVKLAARLASTGRSVPTVHLVSGTEVSIGDLARLCRSAAGTDSPIEIAQPRKGHVSHFVGDPTFSNQLLDWSPTVPLRDGVTRLVAAFGVHTPHRSAS